MVDLFSGPGGLGEGFSRYPFGGDSKFRICLSIEMEENAHRTLTTRAFYRQFKPDKVPEAYYEHLRGKITQEEMFDWDEECRSAARAAKDEAQRIELGDKPGNTPDVEKRLLVKTLISERIKGHKHWVLIGGPPCQAYSLAGRSRMLGVVRKDGETAEDFQRRKEGVALEFEKDHRHLLYKEYLSIIADHWPPIFVMENVKGLLSAKLDGEPVFPMIHDDLANPNAALNRESPGHRYSICSLCVSPPFLGEGLEAEDFLIKAEKYGVPQRRHRVILLGIRDDVAVTELRALTPSGGPSLAELFNGLPPLLPTVSKPSGVDLLEVVRQILSAPWLKAPGSEESIAEGNDFKIIQQEIREALKEISIGKSSGGAEFIAEHNMTGVPGELGKWLADPRIGGVCNHATRSHMDSDLHRYLFSSAFAKVFHRSPKLRDFPESLLPDHSNVKGEAKDLRKFADRFRVQLSDRPAATITCHISQDGHANIHPDPRQIRSLTVREAARIQTFPDNYFFEGSRTAQYRQVGNAVPPFLAHQIAGVVAEVLESSLGTD
ncbi:DNA cytosine methyltransferase [Luteolibacter yonseiensis]|uniref:DNA (cytosine-5-)-methyltransferase n=1 Tax=Luteolibacter yonseiensis TaxID=1144680 RepID=A0A934R8I1_9BACT|nr:DNA cytosine methyltransferase [Luteolibacter yonseiensis]MBK1818267.1 DNA cytosine methyltransferase [Luteolibacter yonseiensis]